MSVKEQFHRVSLRPRPAVSCCIDGETLDVPAGDTVLTAVMTRRRSLRCFEFGDTARAGFCLMGVCQDCWVHLEDGTRLRACSTLVTADMRIVTTMGRSFHGV